MFLRPWTIIHLFLFLLNNVLFCNSARILGMFHFPGRSLHILESALMQGLANAGHDVTIVTAIGDNYTPKNGSYKEVVLTGLFNEMEGNSEMLLDLTDTNAFMESFVFAQMGNEATEKALAHQNVQNLLHSDEKFDVVIVHQVMGDAMKAVANRFNAHLVVFNTMWSNSWVNDFVGNPALPSYVPDPVLSFSNKMTFWQRLENTICKLINQAVLYLYYYPKQQELVEKYIPNGGSLSNALYNNSLILQNGHESMSYPQNSVPAIIDIGGFHLKSPKQLPHDLQEYLDKSVNGVIYFSLGSYIKSKHLPREKREAILKTFGKLKQNVLWKWEADEMPGKPSNVKLGKWLPQADILAHPNVQIFITHGGLLSTTEAIYFGVPTIVIPIFADQKLNAKFAVNHGFARHIPYQELSEETLMANIKEVQTNKKYTKNIKKRSQIMRDRQIHPLDNAVYWVEYIIRHNGANHLRMASLELSWYQFYLLDVLLFCIACVLVTIFVFKLVFKWLCCRRKSINKSKPE